ncbi:MAG: DUF87 domain-containing protein [Candidatus Woesearchaeota archaeon]
MTYNIIVGRNDSDRKKLGERGTVFLGRHYVRMGQSVSLSSNIFLDVARPHVMLIVGKRGSGKSHSLGVIAEEMSKLPEDISQNLSVVIFDTMGIFWTMKYPNNRDENLLRTWNLKPEKLDTIDVWIPEGYFKEYKEKGVLADKKLSIKTSELDAGDWAGVFSVDLMDPVGILIENVIGGLKESKKDYSILDIINEIKKSKTSEKNVKDAAINRFLAAGTWGIFKKGGTEIRDLVQRGRVSVLDISCYTHMAGSWGVKTLVTGLISKKLLLDRMIARKLEELETIESGSGLFDLEKEETREEMPLVWLMIDEAHSFIPKEGKTGASDALIQLLREGRQPGISMVLASQQPGELAKDAITQADIVLSHRLTAKKDIVALNNIMQTYLSSDVQKYLTTLPRMAGAAILLDDNSERIYPMNVRPRVTWHGGEAPTAVKLKSQEILDLGLDF